MSWLGKRATPRRKVHQIRPVGETVAYKPPSKTKREDPELTAAKARVRKRSGGRCEAGTPVCSGRAVHVHHRFTGHDDHRDALLLDVCLDCHGFIHVPPTRYPSSVAYDMGWLIHHGDGAEQSVREYEATLIDPAVTRLLTLHGLEPEATVERIFERPDGDAA